MKSSTSLVCAVALAAGALASPVVVQQATAFTYPTFASPIAASYQVNTSALPSFNGLPVQNSWAGRLLANGTPGIGDSNFFWYFPSSKTNGSNTLTIWLNGGPGCSSLEGATQENGPFVLGPGPVVPVINEFGWTTDFYKFLASFYKVFPELVTKDLYISGESYAGFYIPYIATRILNASAAEQASTPLKLKGLLINDGVFSDFAVSEQAPISRYSVENNKYLKFNATFLAHLNSSSHSCGYETLMDAVKYPQPVGPIFLPNASAPGCDLFTDFNNAAMEANPCFNIYRITDVCPNPVDIITDGSYFSRPDVQAALHVPNSGAWLECSNDYPFVNQTDVSPFTETLLPAILAKIPVLLWHGNVDAILLTAGDLITIQNMTWGGQQGFQTAPTSPLLINGKASGVYHTERSLSFVSVDGAGHMIPQDNPPVALAIFKLFLQTGAVGNGTFNVSSVPTPINGTISSPTNGNGTSIIPSSATTNAMNVIVLIAASVGSVVLLL